MRISRKQSEKSGIHVRTRNTFTPWLAKCWNCATGGETPVPVKEPFVAYKEYFEGLKDADEIGNTYDGEIVACHIDTSKERQRASWPPRLRRCRRGARARRSCARDALRVV